jgi:hypothetical protein
MADILNVSCDDSLIDENGKICLDKGGLIAYAHGEYFALGEKIGKFGFSAAKGTKNSGKSGKKPPRESKKAVADANLKAPSRTPRQQNKKSKVGSKKAFHSAGARKKQSGAGRKGG